MTIHNIKSALWRAGEGVIKKHTLQMAAALSYYFVLSLFPALIFLSAVVAYLPVPDLFNKALSVMSTFIPPDSMGMVRQVLSDVISPHRATFLSFGLLGALWAASGGFAAAIEALNIACEVEETRRFWLTRPLAIGLTFMVGLLLMVALAVMILGPQFGTWLTGYLHVSWLFLLAWPYIHWAVAVGFTVLSLELLYFLAPNTRQHFLGTLPGAVLAVGFWICLSYALGVYFRSFGTFNKTYGTLGAAVALMVWLYWISFIMLLGAQLNTELAKETRAGKLRQKELQHRRSADQAA
jgi:membrane protein